MAQRLVDLSKGIEGHINTEFLRSLNQEFLTKWTLETLRKMSLDEYVSVGNPETFCQWVETKTRPLGSINGNSSFKFGVYKRQIGKPKPKNYASDNEHSWMKRYGSDVATAFDVVRSKVVHVAELAMDARFSEIDDVELNEMFKWKVAFLYSNEMLLPIYKYATVKAISDAYGINFDKRLKRSKALLKIVQKQPASLSVFEYSHDLYHEYGAANDGSKPNKSTKKRGRKPTTELTNRSGTRKGTPGGKYVDRHVPLQRRLAEQLCKEYPDAEVDFEGNWVDVKVTFADRVLFYEVKTKNRVSDSIKDGLGQILSYVNDDESGLPIEIFIAGAATPTEIDLEYIRFLKERLRIDFDYRVIK